MKFDYSSLLTLSVVAIAALLYFMTGRTFLHHLMQSAKSFEDADTVLAMRYTTVGRLFAAALILTWPLWVIIPRTIATIRAGYSWFMTVPAKPTKAL